MNSFKIYVHVDVVKGYILPKTVNSKSLVIDTSNSGNTVKTMLVLKNANKIGCKTIVFSEDGKMKDFVKIRT